MITIYRVIAAYLVITVLLGQLMPLTTAVLPPQVAQQYTHIYGNFTSTFIGNLSIGPGNSIITRGGTFQQIFQQSFGSTLQNGTATNNTGVGFFSGITVFSGLAFVFSTIGFVLEALLNVPRGMLILLNTALSSMGIPIAEAAPLSFIFYAFVSLSFVLVGISSWMKYDLRNG